MDELVYINELYDYYKKLLTDKQRCYFEDYYFDNLTIQEIADNYNISKNAVSKSLLEIKDKLYYYEENMNLLKNNKKIKNILNEEELKKIEDLI